MSESNRKELQELNRWFQKIRKAAKNNGLFVPKDIYFFLVNREQMEATASWGGLETRYSHWSFGKRALQFGQRGVVPREKVIPSVPARVFLLKSNSLAQHLGALARAVAWLDFGINNFSWKKVNYSEVWNKTREHRQIISEFEQNLAIGRKAVRDTLTAAHAIAPQCSHGIVLGPRTDDLLIETLKKSKVLSEWQRKILEIIHAEWIWSLPVISTELLYNGWMSLWEWRLLKEAGISGELFSQCLEEYSRSLAFPRMGELNPALVGFRILEHIERNQGRDALFKTREEEHDISYIEKHLTQEVALGCGLFSWGQSLREKEKLVVKELSDPHGWQTIRGELVKWLGENRFPAVRVASALKEFLPPYRYHDALVLKHEFEGRFLDKEQTGGMMKHLHELWKMLILIETWEPDSRGGQNPAIWSFNGKHFETWAPDEMS